MIKISALIISLAAVGLTSQESSPEVEHETSPPPAIDIAGHMLSVARAGKGDIVYDLGSANAEVALTAAQDFGSRGVWVFNDSEVIDKKKEIAAQSGIIDWIRFVQADPAEADFSDATVLTVHGVPGVEMHLRPRLIDELRPGTRVVTLGIDMGAWQPDSQVDIQGHTIKLHIVPANVTGMWHWVQPRSTNEVTLRVRQRYQNVEAALDQLETSLHISDIYLHGSRLGFTLRDAKGRLAAGYHGIVQGNTIKGQIYGPTGTTSWRARRDPSTMGSILGTHMVKDSSEVR